MLRGEALQSHVMSEVLLSQHTVGRVIGAARLLRLIRSGWLLPRQRTPARVFFSARDVRAALRRLERGERLPPDRIESGRVTRSRELHGKSYVKKGPKKRLSREIPQLDWSGVKL